MAKTELLLRSKYDPDRCYLRAEAALDRVTKEEALSWGTHPCTEALMHILEGDLTTGILVFIDGGYVDSSSVETTAMNSAANTSKVQALEDVIDRIQFIVRKEIEETDDDETDTAGLHGSYQG